MASMNGKMLITKCFKCDEDFEQYLGRLLLGLPEYNLSEIIRQSVLIAGPFLLDHPNVGKSVSTPRRECQ